MSGGSWTHLAARPLVRPMLGTWIRPNHLTTLRLLFGVAACVGFAVGSPMANGWGGLAWLISAFLDRADGELARMGNLGSPGGHLFDYWVDNVVNALFFIAAGIGLRGSWLGGWAVPLGLLGGVCLFGCSILSEHLERHSPPDTRAYSGRWGFDPDDALYLMGPLAWLGWLAPILLGTAIATPIILALTAVRLLRLLRAPAQV
jgi:phosphatidylglycerophosphate synthase